MTSQISLSKLMKIDFLRRRWNLVLSIVIQMVFGPLIALFMLTTKGNYDTNWYIIHQSFLVEYSYIETPIIIVGATILALIGFRQLFSKRMMDLFGSIPVSRTKVLAAGYINSFLIWFLPYLASVLLTTGMFLAYDSSLAVKILSLAAKAIISGILCFLVVYNMCLVALSLSGHPFVTIVNMVILGIVVFAIYGIIAWLFYSNMDSFVQMPFSAVNVAWMSPYAAIAYISSVILAGNTMTASETVILIAGSLVLAAVNFVVALILFKNRKNELAEGGINNRIYTYVVRSLTAFVVGMYFAVFLSLFGYVALPLWGIIGIIIGVIVSFGIVNMLFKRSGRAFFKDKFVMIGTLAFTILVFCVMVFDLIGYDKYIPSKSNIVSANIIIDQYQDDSATLKVVDGAVYNDFYSRSQNDKYTLTDVDKIYELLETGVKNISSEKNPHGSGMSLFYTEDYSEETYINTGIEIKVNLSNGTSYSRRYYITDSQFEQIEDIINSKEYIEAYYSLSLGNYPLPNVMRMNNYYDNNNYIPDIENKEVIELLMECYTKDFKEHRIDNIGRYSWNESIELCYMDVADVDEAEYVTFEDDFHNSRYAYLYVFDEYERTKAATEIVNSVDYASAYYGDEKAMSAMLECLKEIAAQ